MTVHHDADLQRFEIRQDGATAVAEYQRAGNTLILTHTEVPPALRGTGLGNELARAAFEYARDQHLRVLPRCPFMAAWLRRHREYQDLATGPA